MEAEGQEDVLHRAERGGAVGDEAVGAVGRRAGDGTGDGEEREVATDGGTTVERSAASVSAQKQHGEERPANCDCLPTFEDLPCWPCYRKGFRTPNPNAETNTKD